VNPPSTNRPNDPELDALLGAYALDALDVEERLRVDEYLATNQHARDEVDELRESAASLALTPVHDLTAPPELWERISSRIAEEPRTLTPLRPRERRFWTPRIATAVAAAAAVVVVVLAVQLVVGGNDTRTGDLAGAFDKATRQEGARRIALAPEHGGAVARVVLLPDGTGFLQNDQMQTLPSDRTYQLWALTGDPSRPTAISAGVLGSSPRTVGFHVTGDVHGFGLTVEKAPGVISSTQPLYAGGRVN